MRNIIEKAVSICVIIPNNRKVKKFQLHIIDQFRHGYKLPKKVELPWFEKKEEHTSCKHVSEGFVNFTPKGKRLSNSCHVDPLETIWMIVDETTYKDPAPKTLDGLETDYVSPGKNVSLDTLWELVHSIPHHLKNVRRHKGRHFGY